MRFFLTFIFLLSSLSLHAALTFEEKLIEVDAGLNDKTVTRDFKFSNKGSETVTIREADAGCSCLAVQVSGGKLTYAPGEGGVLRTTFELGTFQGTVDKEVNVWLEGDPDSKPSSSVVLRVHIPEIISIEPKTLKWEVGGDGEPLLMEVKMNYEKPIKVTSIQMSNPDFEAKLLTVEEGKHYQIEVTPTGVDSPGLAILRIETDAEVEKQRIQQGFAVIKAKK